MAVSIYLIFLDHENLNESLNITNLYHLRGNELRQIYNKPVLRIIFVLYIISIARKYCAPMTSKDDMC